MRLHTDAFTRFAYSADASFFRLVPAAIAFVDDEDDVRAVLTAARDAGLPVTFRAAGTSLSGQAVTEGVLAVLGDGWRHWRIEDDRGDHITLGPGMIVAEVNRRLAPYHRRLGPDPASQASCKIGGVVANNSSGMCCGVAQNTYHTMTRLKLVLADGKTLDSGDPASRAAFASARADLLEGLDALAAKVKADRVLTDLIRRKYAIKNTVGYALNALVDFTDPIDILTHLVVGSEGTLGFVSEVTYETVPDYPHKATALIVFPDAHSAATGVMALERLGVAAAEFMERLALRAVEAKPAMAPFRPVLTDTSPAVLVEIVAETAEALDAAIAGAGETLEGLGEGAPLSQVEFSRDPDIQAALWDVRKGLIPAAGGMRPAGTSMLTEDVAVPIDRLADAVGDLRALLDRHGYTEAIIFGHALAGNLHFQMAEDFARPGAAETFDAFNNDLAQMVSVDYAGSLKAEHGTGRAISAFVEKEWGEAAYQVMRRIKDLFDPEGLLNPGVLLNSDAKAHAHDLKPMPVTDTAMDLCIECGFCEPACPSAGLTLSPRQRIVLAREIERLERTGDDPARLADFERSYAYAGLDTCAACNLCAQRCPVGIETGTNMIAKRGEAHSGFAKGMANTLAGHTGLVETGLKLGLGAAATARSVLGNGTVDSINKTARKLTGDRLPMTSPSVWPGPGRPGRARKQETAAPRGRIVYFPSCPSRMFAEPRTPDDLLPLPEAMTALLRRAGFEVILPTKSGLCCGRAFSSQGYADAAETVRTRWHTEMRALSRDGELPIVADTSSCVVGSAKQEGLPLDLADSAEFLAAEVLPHLEVTARLPVLAVHHNCSAQRMAEQKATEAVAKACADDIAVLTSVTCCGYAGDRGMAVPELNTHALRFAGQDLPEGCARGVTTVTTCGIGLTDHLGIPFVHLASQLEWASRPR